MPRDNLLKQALVALPEERLYAMFCKMLPSEIKSLLYANSGLNKRIGNSQAFWSRLLSFHFLLSHDMTAQRTILLLGSRKFFEHLNSVYDLNANDESSIALLIKIGRLSEAMMVIKNYQQAFNDKQENKNERFQFTASKLLEMKDPGTQLPLSSVIIRYLNPAERAEMFGMIYHHFGCAHLYKPKQDHPTD